MIVPSGAIRPIVPVALPVNHNVAPSAPTASPCGDGFSGVAQLVHWNLTSIVWTILPAASRRTISPANSSETHSWPLASNAMPWGPLPSGISNVCIVPSRAARTMVLAFWPVIQKLCPFGSAISSWVPPDAAPCSMRSDGYSIGNSATCSPP